MRVRLLPVLAVCALAGCSKIHESRTFSVDVGDGYSLKITAPVSEQKLKIVATADNPVNVWVLLDKDIPGGKDEFDPTAMKSGVVASEKKTKEATLNVTIPAKENFRVYVDGALKKASVTVKIDSQ